MVAFHVKQGQDDSISQASPQSWWPKGQGCLSVTASHFESSASCTSQVKMFRGTAEDNLWQEDKLYTCLSLQSQSPHLMLSWYVLVKDTFWWWKVQSLQVQSHRENVGAFFLTIDMLTKTLLYSFWHFPKAVTSKHNFLFLDIFISFACLKFHFWTFSGFFSPFCFNGIAPRFFFSLSLTLFHASFLCLIVSGWNSPLSMCPAPFN